MNPGTPPGAGHPGAREELAAVTAFKFDGRLHRRWQAAPVLAEEGSLTVLWLPAGTKVEEADGRLWEDDVPVVHYLWRDRWYDVFVLLQERGLRYYCNLTTPVEWEEASPGGSRHGRTTDLDVDVLLGEDGRLQILDLHEFELHRRQWSYPERLVREVERGLAELLDRIRDRQEAFSPEAPALWRRWLGSA
ncbi:MAG: DUF402 domain-containing protein [Bacillota bacterium]|nr:DUF402 domain-containing protein [Bacillota bacterium]